ncbi:hypothetical protein D9758_011456 [Tetrapyrgos nigripes]|uniref:UDP-Glycosyltransferase/glycogen phosphorylase n=1 Tax=Tetrapyrgos nigripes TaxID=182062 RepID=A0A8H5FRE1_9AGAR|nr:hypothetical protein D9758_011456 [Tetrapyrgos nigripes]
MSVPYQKHILFHCVSNWGHNKPIVPFAAQIIQSRPNVIITVFTTAIIYPKLLGEVGKLATGIQEDAKLRFHVIDIAGPVKNPLVPLLQFEPTFKALHNGEPIKCFSSGKEYTDLPKVTVTVIDPFAGYAFEAIRGITESSTPILTWYTSSAGNILRSFKKPPTGKLDVHTLRYGTERELMPRMGDFLDPIVGAESSGRGIPTMYDYEFFPQELPLLASIFLESGRLYMARGEGTLVVSASSYDGAAMEAVKEWYQSLGKVIYPVGPLSLPDRSSGQSDKANHPVMKFLDKMHSKYGDKSVVYMSFGTFFWPKNPEKVWAVIEELIASETPLIWAHPAPFCQIPEDKLKLFQDNSEIALEVQWAPQEAVLSHPATGWFISHGGWNSIQEAMICRVPQILWPQTADQPQNAATLTLSHKAGFELIEVRTGENGTRKPYRFKDSEPAQLPTFTVEAVRREIREVLQKLKGEEGLLVRKNFERLSREVLTSWDENPRGEARESMEMFLKKDGAPQLQSVSITPPSPSPEFVFAMVSQFQNLRTLTLNDGLLTKTAQSATFRSLKELDLRRIRDASTVLTLLTLCRECKLELFSLQFSRYNGSVWEKIFGFLSSQWSRTLTQVDVDYIAEVDREADILDCVQPLCSLQNIQIFKMRFFHSGSSFCITDALISNVCNAWPNLTSLSMYSFGYGQCPTVASLKTIYERCPKLKHVSIPFDITHLPPIKHSDAFLPSTSSHKLECITIFVENKAVLCTLLAHGSTYLSHHLGITFPYLKDVFLETFFTMPEPWPKLMEMIKGLGNLEGGAPKTLERRHICDDQPQVTNGGISVNGQLQAAHQMVNKYDNATSQETSNNDQSPAALPDNVTQHEEPSMTIESWAATFSPAPTHFPPIQYHVNFFFEDLGLSSDLVGKLRRIGATHTHILSDRPFTLFRDFELSEKDAIAVITMVQRYFGVDVA